MNIRHLEILEAVEQTKTFTGAAKNLHLTQSAVSHAIAELESQAGTALFERLPRGVCLTPCGQTLLEEARSILMSCRSLDQRISHLEECAPLHIVSSITIASFLLPRILSRLKTAFPELRVYVRVASAASALAMLEKREADIAFWEGATPQGAYQTIQLGAYQLGAVCAPAFPLEEGAISLQRLASLPLLLREPGSAVRETFDSALSLAGLKASPIWESVNSFSLIQAAEAGLGAAILPEDLVADSVFHSRLRRIPLQNVHLENKMLAVLHADKYITHPLRLILDAIQSEPL